MRRIALPRILGRRLIAPIFLLILIYFLALAGKGVFYDFNPDDMMNMYVAWTPPYGRLISSSFLLAWPGELRPVGGLFYRIIHDIFGFTPLPFRVACFALLIANLWLQFCLYRKLARSLQTASLALLLAAFNGSLWSIYASTGTVYDVLCQFFILLSVLCYMRFAAASGWRRVAFCAASCLSAVLAVQSKEMGLAIPAILLAYEGCYLVPAATGAGQPWRKAALAAGLRVLPFALVGGLVFWGMRAAQHILLVHPAYTPQFSWAMYAHTSAAHLTLLAFRQWTVPDNLAVAILAGSLALAAIVRSRLALFGWLFFIAALAPLSFVQPRHDGYVLYIPYIGCALYLAGLADGLSRLKRAPWMQPAVCLVLGALVVGVQLGEQSNCVKRDFGPGGISLVRDLAQTVNLPGTPTAHRVIVVDGAWGDERWQPMFILRLSRGVKDLEVVRTTAADLAAGNAPVIKLGDQVLTYSDHVYREAHGPELTTLGFRFQGS